MLINVSGSYGTFKTTFLVLLADILSELDFVSNFNINIENVEAFDIVKLLKNKYENVVVLLDEAYVYLESRTSTKHLNRVMSYVLFQSRKVGMDIITTEQIDNTIDLRFRTLCDLQINCKRKLDKAKFTFLTDTKEKTITIPEYKMRQFYPLFDTKERINHFEDMDEILNITMNPQQKLEYAREIAEEIKKLSPNATISEIRAYFTQYSIKRNWLDLVKQEFSKIKEKKTGKSKIEEKLFEF